MAALPGDWELDRYEEEELVDAAGEGIDLEWTSELADHGLGGDARFDRHILNIRGYLAFSDRQLFSGRAIVGLSNGDLPLERQFSLGGIGTIHGYAFKEVSGTGMALMNGEYRVRLVRAHPGSLP